jgi:hypothetical protein
MLVFALVFFQNVVILHRHSDTMTPKELVYLLFKVKSNQLQQLKERIKDEKD